MTFTRTVPATTTRRAMRWMAVAALAALPTVMAVPTYGQQRVGSDGRANDANNRVGSNGVNALRPPPSVGVAGNNIVNGNVTAGREFHGNAPSSDLAAFHGSVPGSVVDNFIKNSTPIGVGNTPPPIPNQSEAYFGLSRNAAPPAGFTTSASTPGYTPSVQNGPIRPNDGRLGNVVTLDATPTSFYEKPIDLLVAGYDPLTQQAAALTASPLYGVRSLNLSNAADMNFANRFARGGQDNPFDRLRIDPRDIAAAREELRSPASQNNAVPDPGRSLVQPLDGQRSDAITQKPLSSDVTAKSLSTGADLGGGSAGTTLRVLAAPGQQSAQYAELAKRLEQYHGVKKGSAQEAALIYNAQVKAHADAVAKAGSTPVPRGPMNGGSLPGADTTPKNPLVGADPGKADPLVVPSLVPGVAAKGLAEMLKKAEDLMRAGKFTTAIDQYAAAEQIAPNQPLIWIGRANAELGASYYGRAEVHLKNAFKTDNVLLMAQYDLRSFLGEDRMASVIKDLKDMASLNPQSTTPVFLLGYIAYNTGNVRRAAAYMDAADKRSGGKDPIFPLLRDHWSLPPTDGSTDPEKSGAGLPEKLEK